MLKIDRLPEVTTPDVISNHGFYSSIFSNTGKNKVFFEHVYPDDSTITTPQRSYIKNYIDNFEQVLLSPSFADPVNGYRKFINVTSFIDFFILNELSKNIDGYKLSTYMFKDNDLLGGKLTMGPVWDYDITWHNADYGNAFDPTGWEYMIADSAFPVPIWWERMLQDPSFADELRCRWFSLRQNVLSENNLNTIVDSCANVLNQAQGRNFTVWPILGTYVFPNPQPLGLTYHDELADLKKWISTRTSWMDSNMFGSCITSLTELNQMQNHSTVYPNPANEYVKFKLLDPANSDLRLYDATGKELSFKVILQNQEFIISTESFSPVIYFFRYKG
jgi:hypothetical protein